MKFKQIQRNGLFSWSPNRHETSVAIGTTSQQFDANFSNDSKLEIFDLNVEECNEDVRLKASKVVNNAFNCIQWHPNAVIGGTQVKTLQFFDVTADDIELRHETEAQTSGLSCIALNAKELQTLAIGCSDGSVGVWDIDGKGKAERSLNLTISGINDSINAVKWNRQVSSILAAASNSSVNVWDTRKPVNSGPIMRVHDNNAASLWGSGQQSLMVSRSLVWSESNATTLIIANSNDSNPILQLWDLRYATCPLNYFKGGHSRGVQSISWNKYDEQLLLSAGKDNAVCLWDPSAAVNEESLQAIIPYITNQWINEIEWCEWEPSLFAVNSFDGNTTIYNITQTNSLNQTNTKILESFDLSSQNVRPDQMQTSAQRQPILTRAPKWLRIPCRPSFGFGGKLVTYDTIISQSQTQPPVQYIQHVLSIHQVMTDTELLNRADKLENALSNGNFLDYCQYKMSEHSDDEIISKAWKLISFHLESDVQKQRETLMGVIGIEGTKHNDIVSNCDLTNSQFSTNTTQNNDQTNEPFGTDFSPNDQMSNNLVVNGFQKLPNNMKIETLGSSLGSQINRGILSGDVGPVIKDCIQNNNWTEAILMCCFVSPEHTASTLRQYFDYCLSSNTDSWSPLLWSIITAQTTADDEAVHVFEELIAKFELKYWPQVLAFIIKESENWEDMNTKSFLIDNLAKRLIDSYVDSGSKHWLNAGMYCFIINADYNNVSKFVPFGSHLDRIELSLILQKSTNAELRTNQLTAHYAKLLAIEGRLELALKYIGDNDLELRDRIMNNIRPNATRLSTQTNVSRVNTKPIQQPYNRAFPNNAPTYPTAATPMSAPVQYTTPYGMAPNSMPYPQSSLPPAPQTPLQRAPPVAPGVGPQMVPNMHSVPHMYGQSTQQNMIPSAPDPYRAHNYSEQQFMPQDVTPGWNDPPVPTKSRHNSFSAAFNENHSHVSNPMPTNTIATPLPVIETQRVLQNANQISQPMAAPQQPLSPQNQQIVDSFDRLLSNLQLSPHSQALNIRRKLDDSRLKLETLKSKLGPNSQLSGNAVLGLSQIASAIDRNDFHSALDCHTNLVATTTFGETAAFLPAIKVILHLAQQRIHT